MDKSMNQEIAVCRVHWVMFAGSAVGIIAALIAAIAFREIWVLSLASVVIAAALLARILIKYRTTYIQLTENYLISHTGFLNSKTLTMALVNVQDIVIGNGLMGKALGYHTITISNAGAADHGYVFPYMTNARKFVDRVRERMVALQ